ncbi:MAG: glycosyltransferase family 4 protein [Planctomycetota bacterium]
MKVLMFGWEFPPFVSGGLGTACFGLTRGLVNRGMEVTFVVPKLPEKADSHVRLVGANRIEITAVEKLISEVQDNLKVLEIDSALRPYLDFKEYAQWVRRIKEQTGRTTTVTVSTEFTGAYGPDLMSEIVRYALIGHMLGKSESFDVIHAHDWLTILAGIEAKRASGKPLIVHMHALEFDRSGDNVNQAVYDLERRGMEAADLVIAVSYYTRDLIVKRYGIPESKIRVVHNAVTKEKTIERLHIKKNLDEKIVLFLGRITFQKGPEYFVEAARRVIERVPGVRFVMAGTGDMFRRMVEHMAALRLGKYFHFTGFLKGTEVERMFAMSDLYVMPSVSEPFGITPLEAILYDVPVIVSKQSGVAEVLDHAIKVDFWDTEKLADKIIAILSQPALARQIAAANSRQIEGIKWEIAADKVIAAYRELAGDR